MELSQYKKLIIASAALLLTIVGGSQASAVYMVHDSKVYAQIVEQINKVNQQISQIRTQIDLQRQNMQDLVWSKIDPILSQAEQSRKDYEDIKSGMNALLSGKKNAEEAFKDTFKTFDDLDVNNLSYAEIKNYLGQNRMAREKINNELITLINYKQKQLEESQDRIKQYQEMMKDTKGQKEIEELNALINNENVRSKAIAAEIDSLRTKQTAINAQAEKLEADAAEKTKEKGAQDFKDAGSEAKNFADKQADVTSLSPKFYELDRGWGLF